MHIKSFYTNYALSFSDVINTDYDFIISDNNIYKLYTSLFKTHPILINAIESNKNIESALNVCKELLSQNVKKNSKVLVLGGGITQDICGFAMNILFRGINWTYIPTTLLAQADSCIGSKTSLNLDSYKNIIGTFYPPTNIVIDCNFLETLDKKDFFSGIGEVVKLHLIGGAGMFSKFNISLSQILNRDIKQVKNAIKQCLDIKKLFIEEDEFDIGKRQILNYGHTFGHAIESETNYSIPHGIAVIYGIMIANKISHNLGLLSADIQDKIEESLIKIIKAAGFDPVMIDSLDIGSIIEKTKKDKKNTDVANINMILIDSNYKFTKVQVNIDKIKQLL
jgi:3-dehydroquinate synthase